MVDQESAKTVVRQTPPDFGLGCFIFIIVMFAAALYGMGKAVIEIIDFVY